MWITGASSGIGAALAFAFNEAGAHVILSARSIDGLHNVQKSLKYPEKSTVITMDMASETSIEDAVLNVSQKFETIDILVHNAGLSQRSLAIETQINVDRQIMETNYFGTIIFTKRLLTKMLNQSSGQIVVISSVTGKVGVSYRSAYAASKHALHGFFDSLRAETEKHNIYITLVCPGYVKTNIGINALKGDGSTNNEEKPQTSAMEPNILATKILKAVKSKKREVYFGGKELLIIYIKRYLPSLYYKIIQQIKP